MQEHSYDDAFFDLQRSGSYKSASVIIPLILNILQVNSVCDVGCGLGTWLRCWRECGVDDVVGIDGNYIDCKKLMIPVENFKPMDLREPLRLGRKFDLVSSLEVAEHLPPERGASFVNDLTSLSSIVLFSAAVPMQRGTNHINERWQDYWANLFHERDFFTFDVLRPRIWHERRVEYWYRQNVLLFCHKDAIERYPGLIAATISVRSAIPVVHPEHYLRHPTGTWEALATLRKALRRSVALRIKQWLPAQSKAYARFSEWHGAHGVISHEGESSFG